MRRTAIRRLCLAVLLSFASLFLPGSVRDAWCQVTFPSMIPGYSTYTSYTTDGTYIYTSVEVSGVVNGTCPTQPAYLVNECHSTTHKPQAYNMIGSVGGWEYGNATAWNSYLGITNTQQVKATPGTGYTFAYSGEVICSFIGLAIYDDAGGSIVIGFSKTTYQGTYEPPNCVYSAYCQGITPSCNQSPLIGAPPCDAYDVIYYVFAIKSGIKYCAEVFGEKSSSPGGCT